MNQIPLSSMTDDETEEAMAFIKKCEEGPEGWRFQNFEMHIASGHTCISTTRVKDTGQINLKSLSSWKFAART